MPDSAGPDSTGPAPALRVVDLTTAETFPLRADVLRSDTVSTAVDFPEDAWPGTFHLGVVDHDVVVATSTWVPRRFEGKSEGVPAVQLRGMATARPHQGQGVGSLLLAAGCARASAAGFTLVWAHARDSALAFYERHEFAVHGEGFVDPTTGLAHHVVVRRL